MDSVLRHIVQLFQSTSDIFFVFAVIVAGFLLLSGIDDLVVDLYYWFNSIFRRKKFTWPQRLSPELLHTTPQKPIALFIPLWHEQDVAEPMLRRACTTIDYVNYEIFVGIYPNDPATTAAVMAAARDHPQIHPVFADHEGPSTKAQNLNAIHQGMIEWENITGLRYDIIVLHDAEDLIHPLSLKCYNCFLPEYDMVQIPVYPLETKHHKVVHWTYADEFAENHTKDLMARQQFSGFTPSAGVGTAYNRWLMEFAGTSFARHMFRRNSLTEDYDIALRLALSEAKLLYLYRPFGLDIATWAYFPETFSTAVRQRTRWLIGICIQSWKSYGWVGSPRFKFTLYRDRKALASNIVNALAYVLLTYVLLYELVEWGLSGYGRLVPIITPGTWLWYIVLTDTFLMLWRFMHRFITVSRVYGRMAGALSIPRLPVGNAINFVATVRAFKKFFRTSGTQKPIAWEKTAHTFPTAEELRTH